MRKYGLSQSEMRLRMLSHSHWKHCFSNTISVHSALEVITTMRCINRRVTYLLRHAFVRN